MPDLAVIDQISLGGFRDKPNEDRLGVARSHAWVIDGATGLGDPFMGIGSDAAWLAQATHEALMAHATMPDPQALLAAVADALVDRFGLERTRDITAPWEMPCGAMMLVSSGSDGVTLTWIGDCRAIVRVQHGALLAFGASAMSEEAEAEFAARFRHDGDPVRRYLQSDALAGLRASRAEVLKSGDAMILSPDRGFLKYLKQAHVAGRSLDILLMTDGFAAAELRYGLFDAPSALLAAAQAGGLAEIAQDLRRFERETDPESQLKPRWKRSDDATALLLKFSV